MKRLYLGSHRDDYTPTKVIDGVCYIGVSKTFVPPGEGSMVLDWMMVITGDIPQEHKKAYDVLYVDSDDGLRKRNAPEEICLTKANSVFRMMLKDEGELYVLSDLIPGPGLFNTQLKRYIYGYFEIAVSDERGWSKFQVSIFHRTSSSSAPLQDANGVHYTRGMAPEVVAVRQAITPPTFSMKIVKDKSSLDKYTPRTFREASNFVPTSFPESSSSLEHITVESFIELVNDDVFVQEYVGQLRKLYEHKVTVYSLKFNELLKEYEITSEIVKKLRSSGTPEESIKDIYPFFNTYTSTLFHLEEFITTLRSPIVKHATLKKDLGKVIGVFNTILARDEIKEHLVRFIYSFSKNWRVAADTFINYAIMGPSGVGKTSVAKMIGKVLNLSGILLTNRSHVVTRSDLIGRYAGHTAPLVRRMLFSSLEGVLIIDEAYSLAFGDHYTGEAMSEIVNFLDKYIGLSVMVVLGYEDKMKAFFNVNEGMNRRFPMRMVLGEYTNSQLTNILISNITSRGIEVSEEVGEYLHCYVCSKQFPHQAGDMLNLSSKIVSGVYTVRNFRWGENPETDKAVLYRVLCDQK